MRNINKSLLGALALGCCASVASASPLNITVDATGTLLPNGVADSTAYGQANNNPSSNLAFLNQEIGFWNGAPNSPTLPSPATSTGLADAGNSSDFTVSGSSFTLNSGIVTGNYDYVVFHFGGQAGGGFWEALYLAGADPNTLSFTVPAGVGGISSGRFFDPSTQPPPPNNVPDGGTSVMLLGMGLSGLGFVSRKLRR